MIHRNDISTRVPYERLMGACPVLLWATERHWTKEHAKRVGCELVSRENSAWLVLEGRARVLHDEMEFTAGPGEWMFPKPGKRSQEFSGPFHFLSVTLRWQWPGGTHLFESGLTRVAPAEQLPWLEPAARQTILDVNRITPESHYYLGHGNITLQESTEWFSAAASWAGAFCRTMAALGIQPDLGITTDPRSRQLLDLIRASVSELTLDRKRLSDQSGLSVRQIDRIVKQETGLTISELHDANRYEQACHWLLESGRRIKEVAASLGHMELSAFSRWFQRRAGCSPRTYRERFHNDD